MSETVKILLVVCTAITIITVVGVVNIKDCPPVQSPVKEATA